MACRSAEGRIGRLAKIGNERFEPGQPVPSQPLGGKDGFDFLHRNVYVIVDDDIVVLSPVADFASSFGHPRSDDLGRILSPLHQPALKLRMAGRQNEDAYEIRTIALP